MGRFKLWGQRAGASAGWTLADLMLNALGAVTLFLLPLLHRVDAEGKRAEKLQEQVVSTEIILHKAENDGVALSLENEGLFDEITRQENIIQQLMKETKGLNSEVEALTTELGSLESERWGHLQANTELTVQIGQLRSEIGSHQITIDALKQGRPVDVVFLFDTSASMELQNSRVSRAIRLVGELLPRVTTLRVGVITFQQSDYTTFPLQELQRPEGDGGASRTQLNEFLEKATVTGGIVDVAEATRRGMALFGDSKNPSAREVLVLVSDVAPGDVLGISQHDSQRMKHELETWTQDSGRDRRFLALFGHDPAYNNPNYDPSRHRAVYRWLAKIPHGRFEDQAGEIFPVLFETMFSN